MMARGYRPVPRNQPFLLPPDMREWLPADHPVFLVIEVVDHHLDTSAVHATRRAGRAGAAGYDPDMLTALLVWAYANRVTSSRRIEQLCRTDVAFRLICAGQVPDHVTIARFRAGLGPAAAELFDQVLMLCARLGMGRLGVVALDGTKVKAPASLAANKNAAALRELAVQIAAEHAATDAAEDALFGPGVRGDELPAELADPRSRAERIAAALAGLDAEDQAARRREQREKNRPRNTLPPRPRWDARPRQSGWRRPGGKVATARAALEKAAGRAAGRQPGRSGCTASRPGRPPPAARSQPHAPPSRRRPDGPPGGSQAAPGRAKLSSWPPRPRRPCATSPIRIRG
jgi:transposase